MRGDGGAAQGPLGPGQVARRLCVGQGGLRADHAKAEIGVVDRWNPSDIENR